MRIINEKVSRSLHPDEQGVTRLLDANEQGNTGKNPLEALQNGILNVKRSADGLASTV